MPAWLLFWAACPLVADWKHGTDQFQDIFKNKGIRPSILVRRTCGKTLCHDMRRYRRRNRIKVMFGRLQDWRRVATRWDRRGKPFLIAVTLTESTLFS